MILADMSPVWAGFIVAVTSLIVVLTNILQALWLRWQADEAAKKKAAQDAATAAALAEKTESVGKAATTETKAAVKEAASAVIAKIDQTQVNGKG